MTNPSIEKQLLAELVTKLELSDFCIVTADTTVRETIDTMRSLRRNCAFVVGRGTKLIGLFTDRDVLKRVVTHPETWDQPVESIMTPTPQTIPLTASAQDALQLMEAGHFRNVPVINERGAPIGNITHYAVLRFLSDHYPQAVYNLPPDPTNFADEREGG